MAMSENVIRETTEALRESNSLVDVACELGLTMQGLLYRINNNPKIMQVAIERGLFTPERKPAGKPYSAAGPQPPKPVETKPAASETIAPVSETAPKPAEPEAPEAPPKKKSHSRPGRRRLELQLPDDLYEKVVAIAAAEDRQPHEQARYMIKQALGIYQ